MICNHAVASISIYNAFRRIANSAGRYDNKAGLLRTKTLAMTALCFLAETIGIYHSKKSEQTPFSVKYCFGVKPDNDLKSLIKCDWSK